MNDADLRQRLDALTDRIPAQPDAYDLVRTRAGRIRRRRSSAALAGLVVVVAAAVAVPETLRHQAVSPSPSAGAGLSSTCDPAAVRAAARYDRVERTYGTVTTAAALAAWRVQVGGVGAALPPATPVPLCLLIGNLDHSPGGPGVHYELLSVENGAVQSVYTSPDLHLADPMPGVARSQITPWSGSAPTPAAAPATTASAALATAPLCTSHDLVGVLQGLGQADGLVQGTIEISTTAPRGCTLRGNLQMDPLTSTGAVLPVPAGGLPGPTHGVYAPLVVNGVLAPASAAPSSSDGQFGRVLDVTVGNDAGGACAAKDRQTRPSSFRLRIGAAVVVVENPAASTDSGAKSLVGCPGRFYAGGAILQ